MAPPPIARSMNLTRRTQMRKPIVRVASLLVPAFGAAALLTLASCNTVEGAGEDLQKASENTREAIAGDKNDDQ